MSNQVNLSPDSPYWTKIINHICIEFIPGRSSPSPFPLNSSPISTPPPKLYTKEWQNTIITHEYTSLLHDRWVQSWQTTKTTKQFDEKKKQQQEWQQVCTNNYNLRYIDMLVKTLLNLHVQKFPTSKKSHMSLAA